MDEKYDSSVKVSEDVIAAIAASAASEVFGVSSLDNKIKLIAKKQRGVQVTINDNNEVIVDIAVSVEYGKKIQEVASEIQSRIKSEVQSMTGLLVRMVNVHVTDIEFAGLT